MRYLIGMAIAGAVLLLAISAPGAMAQEKPALAQESTEDAQERLERELEEAQDVQEKAARELKEAQATFERLERESKEALATLEAALQQESPAEYVCPKHPDIRATWQATCPECGAKLQVLDRPTAQEKFMRSLPTLYARYLDRFMTPENLQRLEPLKRWFAIVMKAPLSTCDPGMLLAQRGQLGLNEEQAAELEAVAEAARERAKGVLTDAQKEALAAFDESPKTMRDMLAEVMRPMLGRMLEELRESKKLKELQESKESEESKDSKALPDE